MDLEKLLKEKKISKYRLSKDSGVPYSTICDICTGKSELPKCSAETVVRLCHVLGMQAEEMLGPIDYPETKENKAAKKNSADADENAKASKTKKTGKDEKVSKEKKTDKDEKVSKAKKSGENDKILKAKKKSSKPDDKTVSDNAKVKDRSEYINKRDNAPQVDYARKKEEAYKNYCNDLQTKINEMGELNFLVSYLKNNEVEILYNLNRKKESRYLLALVDELCVKYNFPLCKEYDEIRAEINDQ